MYARKPQRATAPSFQISLHVRHPSIDPAQLSRDLELTPAESIAAGSPRPVGSAMNSGVHRETFWVAMLPQKAAAGEVLVPMSIVAHAARLSRQTAALPASRSFEWNLLAAVNALRSRSAALERLRSEGAQVRFVATVDPAELPSLALPAQVASALAQLGMALELEFVR
ncbi:MAG: hypothetical protein ACREUG_03075 [Steroidobacteraceae bacterium]